MMTMVASAVLAGFLATVLTVPVGPGYHDLNDDLRKQQEQVAFEAYLAIHPYQIKRSEVGAKARNENPQARFMQEYLLMIDPVEKRVPVERLFKANLLATRQRALNKGQGLSWTERGPNADRTTWVVELARLCSIRTIRRTARCGPVESQAVSG